VTHVKVRMLALYVIARDEADRLGRCLRSVPAATERVVVIDDRTTDETERVARAEGARVVRAPWRGFAAQKQLAESLCTAEWRLSLDADEWLEDADALLHAIRAPGDAAGFRLRRCSEWLGRPIRHGRWGRDRQVRVARAGGRWTGDVHERLIVDGPVRDVHAEIGHAPYRDVWEHLRTIDRYTRSPGPARRWDPVVRPALHFVDAVLLKSAWRDGLDGLAVAGLGAASTYLKWSRRLKNEPRRTRRYTEGPSVSLRALRGETSSP
jgi:(heptosyl)LPS beta-1,4-glucosyltransferase